MVIVRALMLAIEQTCTREDIRYALVTVLLFLSLSTYRSDWKSDKEDNDKEID